MSTPNPVVDVATNTVTCEGTTYAVRPLSEDVYTVLVEGVPVGRLVFSFGAANGVLEGSAISAETLDAIAEAWFAALPPS